MDVNEIKFIEENSDIFCCPRCGEDVVIGKLGLACKKCNQYYKFNDDILNLFCPNEWAASKTDITNIMKSFYEENPFPKYDDFDDIGHLIDKSRNGLFSKLLDDQIPYGARILECGCGTGQLTNFLSVAKRTVIGTDICINSLKLAQDFKVQNSLRCAHFFQMNLFRPCFKVNSFDLVIANGVLHHTSDPFSAFKKISALVKPEGYILIGLYHKYGRLGNDLRKLLFELGKNKLRFLDKRLGNNEISLEKRHSWFMDQYKNPHESKHTVDCVLDWLKETNFSFIKSIPKTVPFEVFGEEEMLFSPDKLGNRFERLFVDLGMIFNSGKEGGFFTVIGKRSKI